MAVVLEERVNTKKVCYLLEHYTYEKFLTNWSGKKCDAKKEYTKIKNYLDTKAKDNNITRYNHIKGRKDGRLFGDGETIQTLPKNIRGFICEGITTDLDMDNCHPSILLRLCKEYNIECPNLNLYYNERKEKLKNIMEDDNVDYETAKLKVLVATNSNKKINTDCKFLKNYCKEMLTIQKSFLDISDFDYVKDYAKKDSNFEGSFINHILCIKENEILQQIFKWCNLNDLEVHSLMFDGLMVYGDIQKGTLKDIEKFIKKNTIFHNIKLSIKQHRTDFTLPDDYEIKETITYEKMKEEFEKNNCKVGDKFVCERKDSLIDIYTKQSFTIIHEELKFLEKIGNDEEQFIHKWYLDSDKRRYETFGSFPKDSMCPECVYNMWKPFPVQLNDMSGADISKCEEGLNWFNNHIAVLCDHQEEVINFVKMWIAQMFQYPEHKSIELIFISEEGAGKGCFLQFFKKIMGGDKRCWETSNPEKEVFGNFNAGMKDAFLVCFNEVNKSNFFNLNDKKKAIITDSNININIKGISEFNIPSYHRFIAFTNNPDPATKNKRRDLFIQCSNEKVGNEEYFNEGFTYANDLDVATYIYNSYMNYETKPKINVKDIPTTNYDTMIAEEQENPVITFIKEYIQDNRTKPEKIVPTDIFYQQFKDYCMSNYINNNVSKISFAMKLVSLKLDCLTKDSKWIEGKTKRVFVLKIQELLKHYKLNNPQENTNTCIDETDESDIE